MLTVGKTYWIKRTDGWTLVTVLDNQPDGYWVDYVESPNTAPVLVKTNNILQSQEQLTLIDL